MSEEVWQPAIVQWLASPERNKAVPVTSADILENALGMAKDKMTKAATMRIGGVMRSLGWERSHIRVKKNWLKVWLPPV